MAFSVSSSQLIKLIKSVTSLVLKKEVTTIVFVFLRKAPTKIETFLLKCHYIFARHRLDIGANEEFKLTPENDKPLYTQGQQTPIHYRDEVLVESALLQYWEIITTLTYSKYSSPTFAVRKPSGKLRILVDLRGINHLIRHNYHNHVFPIATLADVNSP